MAPFAVYAADVVTTCPSCGQRVHPRKAFGGFVCPLCGHKMSGGSDQKEGRRMTLKSSDVTRLLTEAASATTFGEQQRLIGEAEIARSHIIATAAHEREVDLASAVVADRLTPALVHEHHTASTDWLGGINTAPEADAERAMVAQGSVWYAKLSEMVKQHPDELIQQALGMSRRLAGQYGTGADIAERAFLDHVGSLHARDLNAGLIAVAASGVPQVGETGNSEQGPGVQGEQTTMGLPGEMTSSNRAPAMQDLAGNTTGGSISVDSWSGSVQLPQSDVDVANGDSDTQRTHSHQALSSKERTVMPQHTAACPECSGCQACGGTHRVAVRAPRTAASGLDQIDQIVDAHDSPRKTPYPTGIAFPWEMPDNSGEAIEETEQQLDQREKLKGASRRSMAENAAHRAAQLAYRHVMSGSDDSGWAGDMGAGGVRPGMQDAGNPGAPYPGNLADADPVYGQGGDNGNQPLKPYGADEAEDFTSNPGMNIQPGAPMQYDQAGRANQVGQPTARRRSDKDSQVGQALDFVRRRRELLDR